jgi:hypothetical protein
MRLLTFLVILFISPATLAQIDQNSQQQLVKMAEQVQEIRESLKKYNQENIPLALQELVLEIDNIHIQTLQNIIDLHGWPTEDKVGEKGVQAAFLLVKHSENLVFQQDMLPLIIQSFLDKEGIAGKDVAQFTDNVSIRLGKKQVFGTQSKLINGKIIFAPIENEDSVDSLRAQMGMSTLAEYKETLKTLYDLQK